MLRTDGEGEKRMRVKLGTTACARYVITVLLIFAFSCAAGAGPNNQKKKKDQPSSAPDAAASILTPAIPQQIDQVIGEMLGAFQLGDLEMMHKYYADNATFVSGVYAPPVVGWQNYVPIYQSGMAGFQGIQLIRRNTYIYNTADVAWAMYQWEFLSNYNGRPYSAEGQTTLIFNKVGDKWLIVHNHTSQVVPPAAPAQQTATPQQPGQNQGAAAPPNS
jgi:ketosteroid isomerase-like protein